MSKTKVKLSIEEIAALKLVESRLALVNEAITFYTQENYIKCAETINELQKIGGINQNEEGSDIDSGLFSTEAGQELILTALKCKNALIDLKKELTLSSMEYEAIDRLDKLAKHFSSKGFESYEHYELATLGNGSNSDSDLPE